MIKGSHNTVDKCNHKWQYECEDGTCINKYLLCNGVPDCPTASDEKEELCTNRVCPNSWFKCRNGQCIHQEFKCDNNWDCSDGSDESNCFKSKPVFSLALQRPLNNNVIDTFINAILVFYRKT